MLEVIPPLPLDAPVLLQWTDEQERALVEIENWFAAAGDGGLFALTGAAGTGKSTLVREVINRFGYGDLAAMTGKAALRLSECAGRDATTLHKILYWPPKPGADLRFVSLREPPSSFVVVDEASMMTPSVFADLNVWVRAGVRVLLVGDCYQLPPVVTNAKEIEQHGRDYSVFAQVQGARLDTVMRSAGGVLRAATHVRETGKLCQESFGNEYRFFRVDTPLTRAVDDYCSDRSDHLLITWKNSVRMRANRMVRERLRREGELPDNGEPVLMRRNGQGFLNGEVAECGGFEAGPQVGSIETMWMTLNGARVLVSIDGGKDGEFFDGGAPWVEDWKRYHIDLNKLALPEPIPVTWGYCLTAHAAQGSEARRATVFLERDDLSNTYFKEMTTLPGGEQVRMGARWIYTAVTRAKKQTTMIVGK